MVVFRSFCDSVALSEELIGKMSFSSRFPQYFITAMFTPAEQVHTTLSAVANIDAAVAPADEE